MAKNVKGMTKKFNSEVFFKNDPNNVLEEDKSFIISRMKKYGENGDEAANYVFAVKYLPVYNQLQKSIELLADRAKYAEEVDAAAKIKIGADKVRAYCAEQIDRLSGEKDFMDTYIYSLYQYATMLHDALNLDEVSFDELERDDFIEEFDEKIDKSMLGVILEQDKESIVSKLSKGEKAAQAARETFQENHNEDVAEVRKTRGNANRRIKSAEKKGASVKDEDLKVVEDCVEKLNNLRYYMGALKEYAKQEERKMRPAQKEEKVEATIPEQFTNGDRIGVFQEHELIPFTGFTDEEGKKIEEAVENDPEKDVIFTERELEILQGAGYDTEEKLNAYVKSVGLGVVKASLSLIMNVQNKLALEEAKEKNNPEK